MDADAASMDAFYETEWEPGVTSNALRTNSAAVVTKNSSIP